MSWKWLFLLIACYFLYLLLGAGVFGAIELPNEIEMCETAKGALLSAIAAAQNSTLTFENMTTFSLIVQTARDSGVIFNKEFTNFSCVSNWDFQNAFFFSGTVVTTIGYGNISPGTRGGKTFCIFYALIGIPLFALMFSGLGEKIALLVTKLDDRLRGKTKRTWVRKAIVLVLFASSLCILCLLVPAAIFMAAEGWSYSDSFYYSFITLTTIGFGDFVVGTNSDESYIPIYRVLVYFWILFGMAYMATAISLISDFFKKTGAKTKSRGGSEEELDGPTSEEDGEDVCRGEGGEGSINNQVTSEIKEDIQLGEIVGASNSQSSPKHTQENADDSASGNEMEVLNHEQVKEKGSS